MQRILLRSIPFAILLAAAGWVWLARRAASDLITLHVQDTDLASVVRELEIQSWESILVRPGTSGRITLDVRDQPLTEVLEMISDQLHGRWSRIYALNSDSASFRTLRHAIVEALDDAPGWSGLDARLHPADPLPPAPLALDWREEPVASAARILSRQHRTLVLVEDGTEGGVSVNTRAGVPGEVAERMAEQVHRRCSLCYFIEGGAATVPPPAAKPSADQSSSGPGLAGRGGSGPG